MDVFHYIRFLLVGCIIYLFVWAPFPLYAQTTDARALELEGKIQEYSSKIESLKKQKDSLSSEIRYMDTQVELTLLKIEQTKQKISETEGEIEKLSDRIKGLNSSLNHLTSVIIQKIGEGYRTREVSFLDFLFNVDNISELVHRVQYLKAVQDNDRRLAFQLQRAKVNFEEQRLTREEKKEQLNKLTELLKHQSVQLEAQKKQKNELLSVTQNDETRYKKLLDEAQAQLAGFKSFVRQAGGGAIATNAFGEGSDGWYMSQRDERWAAQTMGYSSENILEVGCLITDIAMVMKKYGNGWNPSTVATNAQYFFSNTAYMLHPSRFSWPNGLTYTNIPSSSISGEVAAGHPVIVGVYAGKYGTHYVVVKAIEGDEYIMHDPYYGPDKKFSEYYSKSSIFVAGVFK